MKMADFQNKSRLIAFYLPQFHPIPENDAWWGKGFTEWTNVTKAQPLFTGHRQPNLPSELGFYDLRIPEARNAQAELASSHGIEGFCYWHYWFNGKRLLERPINEVVSSGDPKFPFCLGWANESWTGIWHGCPDRVLIDQTYSGGEDEKRHFYALIDIFDDPRYLTIEGKLIFVVYKPLGMPEPKRFIDHWRELAAKNGVRDFYFIANSNSKQSQPFEHGFDGVVPHTPGNTLNSFTKPVESHVKKLLDRVSSHRQEKSSTIRVIEYSDYVARVASVDARSNEYPCVLPNWDNTPRAGVRGTVLKNSTPDLFRVHLRNALNQISVRPLDKRVVFIKSWNEWAEGNYLEPDQSFGRGYLEACRDELYSVASVQ
jgi:hypothetical protein